MECPKCGSQMDERTSQCPRCALMAGPPNLPPSYAVPGYATPGYPTTAAPQTSGLAIAALICGIAGLCTCGIGSLVGLILGIVALSQINNDRERLAGAGLAKGGIAAAIITLLIVVAWVGGSIYWSLSIGKQQLASRPGKIAMASTMQQTINTGLQRFHTDTGVYPDRLTDLGVAQEKELKTKVPTGRYHGPYVQTEKVLHVMPPIGQTNIPANPLVDPDDAVVAHHWVYDKKSGTVHSAVAADEVQKFAVPNVYTK